ncbi:MAG: hypothetical protein ABJB01_07175 [Rudaea sp.]
MNDIDSFQLLMAYGPYIFLMFLVALVAGFAWLLRWIFRGSASHHPAARIATSDVRARPVIARMWHGRTSVAKADEYLAFLETRALPDYRGVAGNVGAFVFRRIAVDSAHFLTVSNWNSFAAIETFAGADIAVAKYYPEDSQFLLEFEPNVEHYELYS